MRQRILHRLGTVFATLLLIYGVFLVGIFAAMHQPIERFGRIMSYMPGPLFMVVPFEPMWNVARAGSLNVGDLASDFRLPTVDSKGKAQDGTEVQLSSFRGRQPVVLVFGSYT
jgi:hypothetical protein